jgi:hypothetical protein
VTTFKELQGVGTSVVEGLKEQGKPELPMALVGEDVAWFVVMRHDSKWPTHAKQGDGKKMHHARCCRTWEDVGRFG